MQVVVLGFLEGSDLEAWEETTWRFGRGGTVKVRTSKGEEEREEENDNNETTACKCGCWCGWWWRKWGLVLVTYYWIGRGGKGGGRGVRLILRSS